ncbi:hypothetical protein BRADI_1g55132v3 [Brachypodium distachyon]|uniref:Secreted protein n=1 Tax=Brachypodium distachyon TaxID=15368 RepID=A0A0Q3HCD8_BRADI|nr:hypothetical protein BRADI_1g55132v3 [Brachypodium distachyon]
MTLLVPVPAILACLLLLACWSVGVASVSASTCSGRTVHVRWCAPNVPFVLGLPPKPSFFLFTKQAKHIFSEESSPFYCSVTAGRLAILTSSKNYTKRTRGNNNTKKRWYCMSEFTLFAKKKKRVYSPLYVRRRSTRRAMV